MSKSKKCSTCDAPVPESSKFCTECGTRVLNLAAPTKAEAPPKTNCVHCGSSVSSDSQFCVQCGGQLAGKCDCGAALSAGAKFCLGCGKQVNASPASDSKSLWHRNPGEFARRVESTQLHQRIDVKGGQLEKLVRKGINAVVNNVFGKVISIQEGTRGLLFQHGETVAVIPPGKHDVDDMANSLRKVNFQSPYTMLMIGNGDVELPLRMTGLRTRDDQTTDAALSLVAELKDPPAFFNNVMRTQETVTNAELGRRIGEELVSVMQSIINDCDVEELYGNRELVARIEDDLRKSLHRSLDRFGLTLVQIRFVSFRGDEFEAVRNSRGELTRDQAMDEVGAKRLEFEKLVRERLTNEQMDKFQSDQDFVDFLEQLAHESDVKGLLRDQEWHELRRQYEEKKQDHALCREHLLAALELQRTRELVTLQRELDRDVLLKNQELDSLSRNHELTDVDSRHQSELERAQREFDQKLKQLAQASELERAQSNAQADDKYAQDKRKRDDEHEDDTRDAELAMKLLEKTKELKRKEADATHQRELVKMDQYNSMSTEALIAASDSDKAVILGELKKTETLKGMTEEQILAMAAENSPAIANAFGEKFKAAGGEAQRQQMEVMYERMLGEQKESGEKMSNMQAENAAMLKDIMTKALETQRDVSTAAVTDNSTGPSVIYPPPGSGAATVSGSQGPAAETVVVACGNCEHKSPLGSAFCGECGEKL